MKKVVCDIEANGLTPDKIWCCVCYEIDTNQFKIFREDDAELAKEYFSTVDKVIGHNFRGYDAIWLNRVWKAGSRIEKRIDPLV